MSHRLALLGLGFLGLSCNLGPYPDLLEPVDKLPPIEGDANGWLLVEDDQTQVLVLGEDGSYLWSTVGHDTSVRSEQGTFVEEAGTITFTSTIVYDFPVEGGPVQDREGAQDEEVELVHSHAFDSSEDGLSVALDEVGTFVSLTSAMRSLDMESESDRICLMRTVQLSVRTVQSRIRGFGGAGLLIYRDNETDYAGLLSGRLLILLEGLTNPLTTITYETFADFPELVLFDSFSTLVDSSGTGEMSGEMRFAFGPDAAKAADGTDGLDLDFVGAIGYGPSNAVQITEGDVTGGSYQLRLEHPISVDESYPYPVLQELDLRGCYD